MFAFYLILAREGGKVGRGGDLGAIAKAVLDDAGTFDFGEIATLPNLVDAGTPELGKIARADFGEIRNEQLGGDLDRERYLIAYPYFLGEPMPSWVFSFMFITSSNCLLRCRY